MTSWRYDERRHAWNHEPSPSTIEEFEHDEEQAQGRRIKRQDVKGLRRLVESAGTRNEGKPAA